jgi:hypothetical protein
MPLLSDGPPDWLIDGRDTTGLRQYQHADENCEQAGEADGPQWLYLPRVATDFEKRGQARLVVGECQSAKRCNCTPAVSLMRLVKVRDFSGSSSICCLMRENPIPIPLAKASPLDHFGSWTKQRGNSDDQERGPELNVG